MIARPNSAAAQRLFEVFAHRVPARCDDDIVALFESYAEFARAHDDDERLAALRETAVRVERGEWSPRTIGTFALGDPLPYVVGLAACQAAIYENHLPDEPLYGAWLLLEATIQADDEPWRVAAILSGVLGVGDRRLLPIADLAWPRLRLEAQARLPDCAPRHLWHTWLTFLISRLERDPAPPVRAALELAIRSAPWTCAEDVVLDVRRSLPWRPGTVLSKGGQCFILREWPLAEYARRIAPRLHALGCAHLIAEWGYAREVARG